VLAHRIMLVPEAAGVERNEIVADAVAAVPAL
jgi:MoxR-like ATPase